MLPKDVGRVLGWLFALPLETLLVPGRGGLVLLPPEALVEHREVQARLKNRRWRVEDFGSPDYDLARLGSLAWEVSISKDRRFTLPLFARDIGLVGAAENAEVALVAVGGGALEIWNPEELKSRMQADAGRWEELKRGARLDAEHRGAADANSSYPVSEE